jgi:hypothetical protein
VETNEYYEIMKKNHYLKSFLFGAILLLSKGANGQLPDLNCVKTNLQAGYAQILTSYPNPNTFSYDGSSNYIDDGGNDMFDSGNYLNTDLATEFDYTSGVVLSSTNFGPNGSYFTLELPGLFCLGADMDGVNNFYISGNNGADGDGFVVSYDFQITFGSQTYDVYTKKIYDTSDPSINHMFIVPAGSGLTHTFATDSNDDFDQLTGLTNTSRIYYLLFSSQNSALITDTEMEDVALSFLELAENNGASITTSLASAYCPGSPISVDYQLCSLTTLAGNVFTLELSDELGSFSNPTILASVTSQTPSTLTGNLPAIATSSPNYRVRVVASSPLTEGIPSKEFKIKETPYFAPVDVCIGSDTLLIETNDNTLSWYISAIASSPFEVTNELLLENISSSTSYYTSFATMTMQTFTGLNIADFAAVEHDGYSGDDRGGIAITPDYLYVVGDNNTVRMNANDLSGLTSLPMRDGIFSDLTTGSLYNFYNTTSDTGIEDDGIPFTVDAIKEMDENLEYTGNTILLSQPLTIDYYAYNGMFAGSGFLIFYEYNSLEWYHISLADGIITNIGTNQTPDLYGSENWADWGFATIDSGDTLVYLREAGTEDIISFNVNTGVTAIVNSFTNINDMSSITYSPWSSRMYFHHESESEFILLTEEVAGYIGGSHVGSFIANESACRSEVEIIAIDCTSGLDELNTVDFSLFPNPTNDKINIDLSSNIGNYELLIYDLSGRVVYSVKTDALNQIIDVANYLPGYYLVKIRNKELEKTGAFVKN